MLIEYNQWLCLAERNQFKNGRRRPGRRRDHHLLFRLDFTVGACMLIQARAVGVFAGIAIEIAMTGEERHFMN